MPSFDIVSSYDIQEVDNSVNMVKRDIINRSDFKNSSSSITLSKSDNSIIVEGDNDYHITAIGDMLQNRSVSRKVSLKTYKYNKVEKASGMKVRQKIELQSGINKEKSKNINTFIKNLKLKVNSQIQGEQIRVTAKKIDDLQNVISELNNANIDIPLQFVNMKK